MTMAIVVQKYGGSSVGNPDKIKAIARRIVATREAGDDVVVVLSAMGDTTDDLIELAHEFTERPDERELDVLLSTGEIVSSTCLAIALRAMGQCAISLNGGQAGIQTDGCHSRAKIISVIPERVLRELENGNIVVVAGFQGIAEDMDVTTLGRGGSDTTAVALAISLGASICHIYTDVNGVYTADPRLITTARKLDEIDYDEMLELATYGARVLHSRAVEIGKCYDMPILVASSFSDARGTLIHGGIKMELRNKVRGIAHDMDVAKVTVRSVPDQPGIACAIFEPLADHGISVDTIVQNISTEGITDLTFTVSRNDLDRAVEIVGPICQSIGAKGHVSSLGLGKVSIVGTGMQNTPGYAARMFKALSDAGVNIELISTSEIRITCIIREEKVKEAVDALHRAFSLGEIDCDN